jgi:hypothetical protein
MRSRIEIASLPKGKTARVLVCLNKIEKVEAAELKKI